MTKMTLLSLSLMAVLLFCFLALGSRTGALAQEQGQCSAYDADIEWLESAHEQYSVCYTREYAGDVKFVTEVIEDAKKLMRTKYQVETLGNGRGGGLHVNIMLLPEPNHEASTSTTWFKCCYDSSGGYDRSQGTFAQIPYLTPGHSDWSEAPTFGGARLTPDNFHAKNLTHEFIHAVQRTLWRTRNTHVPDWFVEGQAEYDGMFHTTEYNRTTGFRNLVDHGHRYHRDKIILGQTLGGDDNRLVVTEIYFSASIVLRYLSERFGEDILLRLMKHEYPTFHDALMAEMDSAGTTLEAEFEGMRDWFDRCRSDSNDCDVAGIIDTVTLTQVQPQVGVPLTASVSDSDDGVASAIWMWESSEDGRSGWTLRGIGSGLTSAYTPSLSDVGKYLRATAAYTTLDDGIKGASKKSENPVVSPRATPFDGTPQYEGERP